METIKLTYLEDIPLSTQLRKLTGDTWNSSRWSNIKGGKASTWPGATIKHIKTGKLFLLPKKKSVIIDYFNKSFYFKRGICQKQEVIQISEDTSDFLLCSVPPVRYGSKSFLVGEAMTHKNGFAVYCCCFEIDEKHFLTFSNIQDFEKNEYLDLYKQHLINYEIF